MSKYPYITNAEIEHADICFERGFILSAWLTLGYDGAGQGFGGYGLGGSPFDDTKMSRHSEQTNIAADFIGGILAVAGVEKWSALRGKIIRVGKDDKWEAILAIGHPTKDIWYEPKVRLASLGGGVS